MFHAMQGPAIELDQRFMHPGALIGPVRELLAVNGKVVVRVFSGNEWPPALASLRAKLEPRLGHPLTECVVEWHPDCRSGRLYVHEELAPKSRMALVTNGTPRTMRFRSYVSWQHQVEHQLQPGTLLVIDDANLRRWQAELVSEPADGQNVRLFFRYRLSCPA